MKRFSRLPLALCCLSALAVSGAPVPKGKTGFEAKEWSKVDPGKDCQLTFDAKAGSVTFKVPGWEKIRALDTATDRAPRLMRLAGKGDFDAQVRVRVAPAPGTTRSGFGQVDGALARAHEGTGLGLPLVQGLAALHDGAMMLESAPGEGTVVTVSFPPDRVVQQTA